MLLIITDIEMDVEVLERVSQTGERAVAGALDGVLVAVELDGAGEDTFEVFVAGGPALDAGGAGRPVGEHVVVDEVETWVAVQEIGRFEEGGDLLGEQLAADAVGAFLHNLREGDLEAAGHVQILGAVSWVGFRWRGLGRMGDECIPSERWMIQATPPFPLCELTRMIAS